MQSMFDKEPKHEATQKYYERKQKETATVPLTCSGEELEWFLQQGTTTEAREGPRKSPKCKKCGGPVKGQKVINKIRICPPIKN